MRLLFHAAVVATMAVTMSPAPRPSNQADPANLLSFASGTIVRSYTAGLTDVPLIPQGGGGIEDGTKGPVQIVWEMPGVATLTGLTITLGDGSTGTVSISTTSATEGFRDIGTSKGPDETRIAGASGAKARWVRVAATVVDNNPPIARIGATGTIAPRPSTAPPIGGEYWVFADTLDAGGHAQTGPGAQPPDRLEITQIGDGVNGLQCDSGGFVQGYPGKLSGRTWTYRTEFAGNVASGRLIVNDEGTVIAGADDDRVEMRSFVRNTTGGTAPAFCSPSQYGTGATRTLILNSPHWDDSYPGAEDDARAGFSGLSVTIAGASLLTPALLKGVDTAALNGLCRPQNLLNASQTGALLDWVTAGHKLLIMDSDMCGEKVSYDFLPFKFQSDNPGAKGAEGHELVVVENDSLGTADPKDAEHFVDAHAYLSDPNQQLGDANTVVTQDSHWCGHLFGVNADGVNGFMQMYTLAGKGLIVYDGFDHDDASIGVYQKIRQLEYAELLPSDLPCTRRVDMGFVIASDQERAFVPGNAEAFTVPMTLLSNRGWKGHVTLTVTGDFPATVAPASLELPPSQVRLSVRVNVPATAKPGHYAVTVKGTGSGGQSAQAVVTFRTAETKDLLIAELAKSCKVALYGINFDFNKTTIRKDAEPALQQVLALFSADPSLSVEIGGHTDNVGTPAYNLSLSSGRADAVKAWLVAHGVSADRLTTHGYGDTAPVAPNDSDANRAKNRRVELKKPNCTE